ncbi:DUF6114 domain-containing protein [Streptomyces europaeiscabiei]|uniref:DUF6114 domain-containing protein n=1 Tax=Streptomyces europaeiscabiei TaxID=146819 RepID=A0ABU4NR19_9ACTN|nr:MULTISPECIES: DUF6114 domain-containing protein [Streptomyces]MDX2530616.1 DUF6114 domain-containing protein [Streptomyces europaeiscabiei]MDX2763430.1 DUF6114 domain-containing protein [Streptomyces europaeiscabiei]MDX2773125.1 DUF6114 domain-containing protein [Streptomyces europaeiscabiei]MDX3548141.1 DUF6114 domain-containing protein [Streptomyces europaeiscabiei]MDX3557353.1 DUF6114 domain-containing protein [Streptomyces europaeiscabiei]
MSAEPTGQNEDYLRVLRRRFSDWRGSRPFWAGLLVLLGGFPIMYFPYADLQIGHLTLAMATTGGSGSLIIGVLLVVLGVSLWFQRHVRTFAGTAAILLALVSIPVSNLGGFGFGFLLALIGGALAIAWGPGHDEAAVPSTYRTPAQSRAAQDAAAQAATSQNTAQQGAVLLHKGDAPEPAAAGSVNGAANGEGDDLSGTTHMNGTNGRHSAG